MGKITFILMILTMLGANPVKAQSDLETQRILAHIQRAEQHSVWVLSFGESGGSCSGVVLKTTSTNSVVLTAKHCVGMVDETYVNNVLVQTIVVSSTNDLALLTTDRPILNKRAIRLAQNNAKSGSELFGMAFPSLKPYVMYGKVFLPGIKNDRAIMQIINGCSGGGIFSGTGELVGIVWGFYPGLGLTIYEPVSQIRKFLRETGHSEF